MAKRQSYQVKVDKVDSAFFRVPIFRSAILCGAKGRALSSKLCSLSAGSGNKGFLVIKLKDAASRHEKILEKSGFRKCGETIDLKYVYPKEGSAYFPTLIPVRRIMKKDERTVSAIARDAFRRSYFYRCGFGMRSSVDRYHIKWIKNLIKDKASCVFVAEKNGRVAGFAALRMDKGSEKERIALIAVHKKYRKMGFGRALLLKCLWYGKTRAKKVFVKTQVDNIEALSLYRKEGFKEHLKELIFCKRLG